ncbi:expressed unknown protein [Seminavis robusta]|uniref:Uncharacterized protein n=1 Tax=Seminavis robusta TaxID=568900 RepID=A0A9N8HT39_9STRA|nr:expressed unknown protein [Seminavis robusta]|eukprot:Sro1528_g279990.1 n/a (658) ;mRNA; f:18141-20182
MAPASTATTLPMKKRRKIHSMKPPQLQNLHSNPSHSTDCSTHALMIKNDDAQAGTFRDHCQGGLGFHNKRIEVPSQSQCEKESRLVQEYVCLVASEDALFAPRSPVWVTLNDSDNNSNQYNKALILEHSFDGVSGVLYTVLVANDGTTHNNILPHQLVLRRAGNHHQSSWDREQSATTVLTRGQNLGTCSCQPAVLLKEEDAASAVAIKPEQEQDLGSVENNFFSTLPSSVAENECSGVCIQPNKMEHDQTEDSDGLANDLPSSYSPTLKAVEECAVDQQPTTTTHDPHGITTKEGSLSNPFQGNEDSGCCEASGRPFQPSPGKRHSKTPKANDDELDDGTLSEGEIEETNDNDSHPQLGGRWIPPAVSDTDIGESSTTVDPSKINPKDKTTSRKEVFNLQPNPFSLIVRCSRYSFLDTLDLLIPQLQRDEVYPRFCMHYHLCGQCYEHCPKAISHKPLTQTQALQVEASLLPAISPRGPIKCRQSCNNNNSQTNTSNSGHQRIQPAQNRQPNPFRKLQRSSTHSLFGAIKYVSWLMKNDNLTENFPKGACFRYHCVGCCPRGEECLHARTHRDLTPEEAQNMETVLLSVANSNGLIKGPIVAAAIQGKTIPHAVSRGPCNNHNINMTPRPKRRRWDVNPNDDSYNVFNNYARSQSG